MRQAHKSSELAFGPEWSASLRGGSEEELRGWLEFGLACCDAADAIALASFRHEMEITAKPDRTLVTQTDRAIEHLIREQIGQAYPDHGVHGEEFGVETAGASTVWYIDPIDGTHNFVRGVPVFATLLAVERDGEIQMGLISAPAMRERWFATRGGGAWSVGAAGWDGPRRLRVSGVRSVDDAQLLYGSWAEIEESGRAPGFVGLLRSVWRTRGFGDFWSYALVAEGAAEGMVELGPNAYDLAAPQIIVEEAGGRLTDLEGQRRIDREEVLVSNGWLHDALLARLRASA